MNEKSLIILLSGVLAVCAVSIIYLVSNNAQSPAVVTKSGAVSTVKTATPIGGAFEMVDQNGQTVTEKEFAGKYKLMFFGFTHCPGICPGELTKISTVLDILEEDNQADKITPIFVSIDPARDTPEVMKEYVETYDRRFVGLTGSQEQVDKMKNDYKVHASKVEMEMMEPGNYMMDHSTFTYLMSPQNELMLVFDMQDKPQEIAEEIRASL